MHRKGFPMALMATLICGLLFNVQPSPAATQNVAQHLPLDTIQQAVSTLPGEVDAYQLSIDSPGVLMLEVMVTDSTAVPDLRVLNSKGAPWVLLDRAGHHWTLAILSAGTLQIEVSDQSSRQALGNYRILNRFAAAAVQRSSYQIADFYVGFEGQDDLKVERVVLSLIKEKSGADLEEVDPNPGGLRFRSTESWVEIILLSSATGVFPTDKDYFLKPVVAKADPRILNTPGMHLQAAWMHRTQFQKGQSKTLISHAQVSLYTNPLRTFASGADLEEVDPNPGGQNLWVGAS